MASILGGHDQEMKVFWFFFSKKNILLLEFSCVTQ